VVAPRDITQIRDWIEERPSQASKGSRTDYSTRFCTAGKKVTEKLIEHRFED
jgi:hypothetical protein